MVDGTTIRLVMTVVLLAPCFGHLLQEQQLRTINSTKLDSTYYVSCFDDQGKNLGSRRVKGPILVSPNRQFRAYVEAEATVPSGRESEEVPCRNTTRLLVSGPGQSPFRSVYTVQGKQYELGNGIEPVDWSSDSRYLLLSELRWTYYSDWFAFDVLIYDTRTGNVAGPNLNELFSKHFQKSCEVEVKASGFVPPGLRAALNARDGVSPEEEAQTGCLGKPGLWLLDLESRELRQLPDDYQVRRLAAVMPHVN